MKKKKLALLMVAALTFTNLDGTVVALKAADFAVDLSEETTDEFGDVETPDEQKEEASDIEIEDTDEVGEDLESTEDFDEQQGLDIFSDGEEIECESDQTATVTRPASVSWSASLLEHTPAALRYLFILIVV